MGSLLMEITGDTLTTLSMHATCHAVKKWAAEGAKEIPEDHYQTQWCIATGKCVFCL